MISCDIGSGTTYINIDGETGLVAPPDDAQALRAAMRTLWEQPEMAREMGVRAAQRFQDVFTADRMAAGYTALYREVVARRAATPGTVRPRAGSARPE
jgi:rhamnosyl/mannosyltransferase